ncbi:hypothetical protein VTN77DRAFT_8089 [Rasamsonia byssochlamydoides]|uniref:uncharacterized protein n=1 Tax=Rasamsonia byssochlamydoides TaxID=89139 RepID=UPI003741FF08
MVMVQTITHPPRTSTERLQRSTQPDSLERDHDLPQKVSSCHYHNGTAEKKPRQEQTVLYLAYGSNLSVKTFRGKRGIKPLSQVNVYVPELRLTFDLPGVPYIEPCFAGTQFRTAGKDEEDKEKGGLADNTANSIDIEKSPLLAGGHGQGQGRGQKRDYHKNRWHKPLIGVVYEVTLADYAHIIATEGAGSTYRDVVVTCYPFPDSYSPSDPVPDCPDTQPFKAHTLLSPLRDETAGRNPLMRPDPAYAQPSARYLNLIRTGAAELDFPTSYRAYLSSIRPYRITTVRQRIGQGIFLAIWVPPLYLLLTFASLLADDDGRSPAWFVQVQNALFRTMWTSYDAFFRKVFGDGERTIGDV